MAKEEIKKGERDRSKKKRKKMLKEVRQGERERNERK
jgi:hypothetical protein